MAWGNFILDKGFNASGTDILKYRCVKLTDAEEVGPIAANTDDVIGVSQFQVLVADQARGKGASVRVEGVSEVEASGAIAVGDWCTLEADGRVSTLVGASGKTVVGKCVGTPAAAAGDRISMLIVHTHAKA